MMMQRPRPKKKVKQQVVAQEEEEDQSEQQPLIQQEVIDSSEVQLDQQVVQEEKDQEIVDEQQVKVEIIQQQEEKKQQDVQMNEQKESKQENEQYRKMLYKAELDYLQNLEQSNDQQLRYPSIHSNQLKKSLTKQEQDMFSQQRQFQYSFKQEPQGNINLSDLEYPAIQTQNVKNIEQESSQVLQIESSDVQLQKDEMFRGSVVKLDMIADIKHDHFYNQKEIEQQEADIKLKSSSTYKRAQKLQQEKQKAQQLQSLLESNNRQYEESKKNFEQFLAKKHQETKEIAEIAEIEIKQEVNDPKLDHVMETREIDNVMYIVHKVMATDTLMGLSLRYETPQKTIMTLNNLTSDAIFVKKELLVPAKEGINYVQSYDTDKLEAERKKDCLNLFHNHIREQRGRPLENYLPEAQFYMSESNYDFTKAMQLLKDDLEFEEQERISQKKSKKSTKRSRSSKKVKVT